MPCFKCHTGDALHGMTARRRANETNATTATRSRLHNVHQTGTGQGPDPAAQCARRQAGLPGVPQRRKQELLRLPRADQRRRHAVLQDRAGGDGLQDRPEPEEERGAPVELCGAAPRAQSTRTTSTSTARTCWRTSTRCRPGSTPRRTTSSATRRRTMPAIRCHGNAALFIDETDLSPTRSKPTSGVIPAAAAAQDGQ